MKIIYDDSHLSNDQLEGAMESAQMVKIGSSEKMTFPKLMLMALLYINLGRPQDVAVFLKGLYIGKIFGFITLCCILQQWKSGYRPGTMKIAQNKWFIAMVIIMLFSTMFSVYPRLSVEFLKDFLTTLTLYIGLIFFLDSQKDFRNLAIAVLISVVTLTTPLLLGGISTARVSIGTFYDPNDLAMFITCSLPFVIYLGHHGKLSVKIISLLTIALGLMAVILTQSRMGFLSIIILSIMYIFVGVSKNKYYFKKLIIIGCVSIVFLSFAGQPYWERISTTFEKGQTGSGRTLVWKRGLAMVKEYPALGVGPGVFMSAYGRMLKAGKFASVGGVYDIAWKAGHNSYLKVMVEMGIPGIFTFVALIYITLKNTIAIRKKYLKYENRNHVALSANVVLMSMLTFMFCAFFLSHATSPLFVTLVASSILVQKISYKQESEI